MIFRSKRDRDAGTAVAGEDAESVEALFEEIDGLTRENRADPDPDVERRILKLRHRAGLQLVRNQQESPEFAEPAFDRVPDDSNPPEVSPDEVTPELLRGAMLRSGCLLIRGLIDAEQARRLQEGIDRAIEARDAGGNGASGSPYYKEFEPEPPFDLHAERGWVSDASGLWAADSPRVLCDLLDMLERSGLQRLATDYLGERPAISVNKCTLRKVSPDIFDESRYTEEKKPSAWHQDGAFLGDDIRALNVWLSLSRCGDVAPGMDIVPRRLEEIAPTGTEGAAFDWSVSQTVAEEAAGDVPILRPIFEPGDVLLFDEMFLHATAAEPEMPNTRYAVESWFFGPSGFPSDYAPLAF
jgi:hypothetical protein